MYKIGVVGAGKIAGVHKRAVLGHGQCQLVAVCDIAVEKAKKLAEGTDARVYDNYETMQAMEELDGVILNLPHFLHQQASVYFLDRGISVLVEKPMAISTRECDAMIAAAERSGAKLAVGHMQRYLQCYRILRQMIQSKRLGELCGIREVRNCDYFTNRPAWFLDRALSGGGILMNFGAHTLDKVFYTTGLKVKDVFVSGNNFLTDHSVEAIAQLLVTFEGGVSGTFCYCGCKGASEYRTDFYFTNGAAQIRDGWDLWICEADGAFTRVEGCNDSGMIETQMVEFVKLLSGEENEMATPEYGRRVISVLERAFAQI